jgi:16S rRNA (cytosine1402-N4)-methyltransferase
MKREEFHQPVLVKEVLKELGAHLKNKKVIDATLGTGGHALALMGAGAKVLGIEADPQMAEVAAARFKTAKVKNGQIAVGNFTDLEKIATENGFNPVEAILFDLGVTNLQLTSPKRGFSFAHPEAKLDLRLNPERQGVTGADLLNALRKDQLVALFAQVVDFSAARWLTNRVLKIRAVQPITTVDDFLRICRGLRTKKTLNEATLPFLALRIAVNGELENLKEVLPKTEALLAKGGRLLVITFHSQEEEVLRQSRLGFCGPVKPTAEEVEINPRSRSAKLFVFEKK